MSPASVANVYQFINSWISDQSEPHKPTTETEMTLTNDSSGAEGVIDGDGKITSVGVHAQAWALAQNAPNLCSKHGCASLCEFSLKCEMGRGSHRLQDMSCVTKPKARCVFWDRGDREARREVSLEKSPSPGASPGSPTQTLLSNSSLESYP